MQKVMLWNEKKKKKEIPKMTPNFGKLKNSKNVICYQKPLMLVMKWTNIGKKYFPNLFVLDHGASAWIQSNLSSFFFEVLFRLKFVTFVSN